MEGKTLKALMISPLRKVAHRKTMVAKSRKSASARNRLKGNVSMGIVYAKVVLKNPRNTKIKPITVETLVDSGALYLCIPEWLRNRLKLEEIDKKEVSLADGTKKGVSYVGPIEIHFRDRVGFVGALVLGDQPLLGAIPMEDMDLIVVPRKRALEINPEAPMIPTYRVKKSKNDISKRKQ